MKSNVVCGNCTGDEVRKTRLDLNTGPIIYKLYDFGQVICIWSACVDLRADVYT